MIVPLVAFAAMAAGAVSERFAAEAALRDASDGVADVAMAVERVLHHGDREPGATGSGWFDRSWGLPAVSAACTSDVAEIRKLEDALANLIMFREAKVKERDVVGQRRANLDDFLTEDPPKEVPDAWKEDRRLRTKSDPPDAWNPWKEEDAPYAWQLLEDAYALFRTDPDDGDSVTRDPDGGSIKMVRNKLDVEFTRLTGVIETLPHDGDVVLAQELCNESMARIYQRLGQTGIDSSTLRGYHTNAVQLGYREPAADAAADSAWLLCTPPAGAPHAVYAVLTAQWNSSSWAAAQVWPEGVMLSAEGLHLARDDDSAATPTLPDPTGCKPARDYIADNSNTVRRHPLEVGALPQPAPAPLDPPTP
ncbi:MAG: hypothetical protein OXJ90_22960 [Spirochaetaceae bacterium]|nr:hypothetical protein [Spirochaetaceae bacterium]